MSSKKGFTLIELLVVMAVMSILVGVGVNTFSIAQKKARDAKRKADLRQVQVILEVYKTNTGKYPARSTAGWIQLANVVKGSAGGGATDTDSYNTTVIADPLGTCPASTTPLTGSAGSTAKCYQYYYYATGSSTTCAGQTYMLAVSLEDANDSQTQRADSPPTPTPPPPAERDFEARCDDGTTIDPASNPPDDLYVTGPR